MLTLEEYEGLEPLCKLSDGGEPVTEVEARQELLPYDIEVTSAAAVTAPAAAEAGFSL